MALVTETTKAIRRARRDASYNSFLYPSFFILAAFIVTMLVWNIALSFTSFPGFGKAKWVGFKNYANLFTDTLFWESVLHSLYYVIPMAIIPTVLSVFLAAAVFDAFRGRVARVFLPWVRAGLYLPQVIPIAIAGTIWGWILSQEGLLNQLLKNLGWQQLTVDWLEVPVPALVSLSGIMIWLQFGFGFVIFLAGLARVDIYAVEAAQVDGANWWQRFIHLTLPTLRPEILVVTLITVVGALKVFAPVAYITFGGPWGSTQSAATYAVGSFFGGNSIGTGATVSTLLALIIGITVSLIAVAFVRGGRRKREVRS